MTVQTLPDADLEALAAQMEAWGSQVQGRAANKFAGYLRLTLSANHLPDRRTEQHRRAERPPALPHP
ncbi:MAG: hypothetical protein DRI79_09755 [Chloroflexi bacterium]|nr:MAG: hypothetical protein DRI79_09755 [Chloroflexota bacterium]